MTDELTHFAAEQLPLVEAEMRTFLTKTTNETKLLQAMNYSVTAGGKRLRPLLYLATLAFFQKTPHRGNYQVAAALEMIHTYSLIHDDLPAMDDDDLRRGLPTNHQVYGEALAILAGDGLLTEAFHLLSMSELEVSLKLTLVQALAKAAGSGGMIAGQVADMEGEEQMLDLPALESVHARKTGALFEFAVLAAVREQSAIETVQNSLQNFAHHFGIAFQIKDDLLDVVGETTALGKQTGMDAERGKSTYTSLLGVKGAEEAFQAHCQQALIQLDQASKSSSTATSPVYLKQIVEKMME